MSAQQTLTFLFDAIALSFIITAAFDLGREIVVLYKQVFITPVQQPSIDSQSQQILPDPWLLPAASALAPPEQITQIQQKPTLLLAPAQAVEEVRLSKACAVRSSTDELVKKLLEGINVDTLTLREARKLAKILEIAQKVNGKDQTLTFLRSQIKAKLQQETSHLPEVITQLRTELVAS